MHFKSSKDYHTSKVIGRLLYVSFLYFPHLILSFIKLLVPRRVPICMALDLSTSQRISLESELLTHSIPLPMRPSSLFSA